MVRHIDDTNNNGVFDSGDAIEFVGTVEKTLYSKANVYVLTSDGSKVAVAESRPLNNKNGVANTYRASYSAYPDNQYSASAPVGSIPWYDALLRGPTVLTRTFDLPDLNSSSLAAGATLTVDLWGLSDLPGPNDHHVVVYLNGGDPVADTLFDGLVGKQLRIAVDTSKLKAAGNTLELRLPFDSGYLFDFVGLDGFRLDYPAFTQANTGLWSGEIPGGGPGFEIGNLADCTGLHVWAQQRNQFYRATELQTIASGGSCSVILPAHRGQTLRYWLAATGSTQKPSVQAGVPEGIKRTAKKTEYLMISHPLFASSLNHLIGLQQGRGLQAEVVTTDAIYAAYSDHQRDAEAIQAFIRESARQGGKLRYVLIVGGDNYDYFNAYGHEALAFVPTRYAKVGDLIHFAPTDVLYGDVDGDGIPDLPVGRLIIRTLPELATVVAKLKQYAGSNTGLIVTGKSDSGKQFTQQHGTMSAALAKGDWKLTDLAVDDYPDTTAARTALLAEFGNGHGLVSYLGHSDYDYWDFGPLFNRSDVASLPSGSSQPVVTQWGCWNSYFVATQIETMAHALLLTENKGAASVIGSSTLTDLAAHDELGQRFFKNLSKGPVTLGNALLKAQREVATQFPDLRDDILAMNLLGDPALEMGQ